MTFKNNLKKFWEFLKEDSWTSLIVWIIIIAVFLKLIFFPIISLITGSPLPLVIVESCSMYHESSFDTWWGDNGAWYESHDISKEDFQTFSLKNGLNKGDIVFVWGRADYELGDIIIFKPNEEATTRNPIIHRLVSISPNNTKGDHNPFQFTGSNNLNKLDETKIKGDRVLGKAVARIPFAGWLKLIWFEGARPSNQRGFCK